MILAKQMIDNKKILAIIPARGNSKRLVNKNLQKIGKIPLIVWSIKSSQKSKYIDSICISSEDLKILNIAKKEGVKILIKRPKKYSKNSSKTIDVVLHAVTKLNNEFTNYDCVVLLQPTSPFRTERDIDRSIEKFYNEKSTSMISICETNFPLEWSFHNNNKNLLSNFKNLAFLNKRSQELKKSFRINGAIYITKMKFLLKNKKFYSSTNTHAFEMSDINSIDIDTSKDLDYAKFIYQNKLLK